MFEHKKFQAALIACLIALLGGYASGLGESGDFVLALASVNWTAVIAPWIVAIAGQSIADVGKEKAEVEAASDKQSDRLSAIESQLTSVETWLSKQ